MAASITETIDVQPPREQVFDYVANFGNLDEWDPTFDDARRVDDGDLGVGSTFVVRASVGPTELEITYRITEFDRPHRVRLVGEEDRFTSTDVIEFTALDGGGTRVVYDAEVDTDLPDLLDAMGTPAFKMVGMLVGSSLRDELGGA